MQSLILKIITVLIGLFLSGSGYAQRITNSKEDSAILRLWNPKASSEQIKYLALNIVTSLKLDYRGNKKLARVILFSQRSDHSRQLMLLNENNQQFTFLGLSGEESNNIDKDFLKMSFFLEKIAGLQLKLKLECYGELLNMYKGYDYMFSNHIWFKPPSKVKPVDN